jgi:hypothetical protein
MARSTAQIQADIALTRSAIEAHLDALKGRMRYRWWMPVAVVGGALAAGVLLSRVPVLRLLNTGARVVQTGVAVAGAVAAAQHLLSGRPRPQDTAASNGSAQR